MRYIITGAEKHEHAAGFKKDLQEQARFLVRPLAILACFAWLGFAFIADPRLHPEFPSLVIYRLGLSFLGVSVLAVSFTNLLQTKPIVLVHVMYGYCLLATAMFTGRIANDASYVSGLQIVVLVAPFFPFRLWQLLSYLLASMVLFCCAMWFYEPDIYNFRSYYSLNNLLIVYGMSAVLSWLLDVYRFNMFLNRLRLIQLATLDGLTGVNTRQNFESVVSQKLIEYKRYETPFSFAMLDLDYFKRVNDTYGHAAGDEVLKSVVGVFKRCIRSTDIIGRVGGEEFAIFMTQTSHDEAVLVAERIRKGVEDLIVYFDSGEVNVTISIGVAGVPETVTYDMEALFAEADTCLYKAKQGGRNQVCAE